MQLLGHMVDNFLKFFNEIYKLFFRVDIQFHIPIVNV